MSVTYSQEYKLFRIDTKNSTYAFCITNLNYIEHLYYGKKVGLGDLSYLSNRQIYTFALTMESEGREFAESTLLSEISSGNSADFRDGSVWIQNADGTVGNRFTYQSHEIYDGRKEVEGMPYSREEEGVQTLVLHLSDREKGVDADIYYIAFPDKDIIARRVEIINRSDKNIRLLKVNSLQVDFARCDFDLIETTGMYLYEFGSVERTPLKKGFQGRKSMTGSTSHHHNPFFILCDKNAIEDVGEAYGFNLLYSGGFCNQIEVDRLGSTRVLSGLAPDGFSYELSPNQRFLTPEGVFTYSDQGIGQISRSFHDHIRSNILPKPFSKRSRPLVVNTWEGSYFEVTEEAVLRLAESAKSVGVDTVVLDDGWFRDGTTEGLGDFILRQEKFPHGLRYLSQKIHEMGLNFGIWFEPECVSENSDHFRNTPNCTLKTRKKSCLGRSQQVLDFTKGENIDAIFRRITAVLDEVRVEYLKWDYNRYIGEAGSEKCPYGELLYHQTLGVYKLLDKIRKRYPNLLIEGCAGGGGRFDLGILFYCPQIWISDNTDPYARAYIQYGASYGYPTSAISCHYTKGIGTSQRESTPDFRFTVATFGPFGYELDITKLSAAEKAKLQEYSKKYREIEEFSLHCDLYRILDVNDDLYSAYIQVTKDKRKALFTFIQLHSKGFHENLLVRLKGLKEDGYYREESTGKIYSGSALMYAGIRLANLFRLGSGGSIQMLFTEI